jgi:hypothetical protein
LAVLDASGFVVGVCAVAGFLYVGFEFGSEVPAGTLITEVSAWFGFHRCGASSPRWATLVLVLRAGAQPVILGTVALVAAIFDLSVWGALLPRGAE